MTDISDKKLIKEVLKMSEELRNEEIEVVETVETEDVKDGLQWQDYAVIGGLMTAGALVFEGGKWVWKKTAAPRGKVAGFFKNKFSKKAKTEAEEKPEHEGSTEKAAEKSEAKKSDNKSKK